jgi:hypothetical protein
MQLSCADATPAAVIMSAAKQNFRITFRVLED